MSTTREDLEYHYGNDWTASFTAEDYDGNAIDITGATLRFYLATIDGAVIMTLTESDGLTITSGADGLATLDVTPTHQTNAVVEDSTRYLWEYRVTTSGGVILTQAHGHLSVLPSLGGLMIEKPSIAESFWLEQPVGVAFANTETALRTVVDQINDQAAFYDTVGSIGVGTGLVRIYAGTGAPTFAAAKSSLYLRSDGSATNDRAYINTDGSTTWTAITTVA